MRGAGVNALTVPAFDPYSKQPELKHAAIQAEKLELPVSLVAMRRFAADECAAEALRCAAALAREFDFAS